MNFYLHVSNRTENLLVHLHKVIEIAPLSDPFAKEVLMIQSQGMERWLAQQLALHFKVWANYEFLFPAAFFNTIAQAIDTRLNAENFARDRLLWRLESLLRTADAEVYKPLRHYLDGNDAELKRYQLARQLAQLFDQYQVMRPDMLADWQKGTLQTGSSEERWQRALWLALLDQLGERHRGALWLDAIAKLNAGKEGALSDKLPERISLFGLNTLPPLFLNFLQGVARHTQVHFYLLNPAQSYWADVENKRQLARKNLLQPETSAVLSEGHPLLAALGQQGREFQQLLLEQAEFALELESYEAGETATVLQRLQNDILNNKVETVRLQNDGSITIHACHSRMREVEVLRDQLLHAVENDRQLQLRDIVVMAPDIQLYAPFIGAVFADIQHSVADRSLRVSNKLLDAFSTFLRLSQSRFGRQEVIDLLQRPCIYESFDLSETDLQWITFWVTETRICWGRDAEHKRRLGLPPHAENTWMAGVQRLLMGYAMGDDSSFIAGILPYKHLEGSSAQALGGLYDYLQLLSEAAAELAAPHTLQDWGELLRRYAAMLFAGPAVDAAESLQLQELLEELVDDLGVLHREPTALEVLLAWLDDALDERLTASGFLRGQLTFCSMLPMRAIPFKVIALLGLNEGEFPKIDRTPNFDLLSKHYRKGDRSRRADDRYQFLEIILSARQQLIITYVGQSLRDNRSIPPSVVVDELLEVLQDDYGLKNLVITHPLHPFSPRYFSGQAPYFSYSPGHCNTAQALKRTQQAPSPWWHGEIAAVDEETIEFADLINFYRHPQKYFLRRNLALAAPVLETGASEFEQFTVEGLEAYALQQQWVAAELAGSPPQIAYWQAQGIWPTGALGEIERQRMAPAMQKFTAQIAAKAVGDTLPDRLFDLRIGRYRLLGKFSNLYSNGMLFYRFSTLKGKDLLPAWLQHLIANRLQPQNTYLLAKDEDLLFTPELGNTDALLGLLEIYRLGQCRPDVFFTDAALAYLRQALTLQKGGRSSKSPLQAAQETLLKTLEGGYDGELALVLRNRNPDTPLLDDAFEEACQTLLLPMWQATH